MKTVSTTTVTLTTDDVRTIIANHLNLPLESLKITFNVNEIGDDHFGVFTSHVLSDVSVTYDTPNIVNRK